ncbi:MAG: DUF1538 domain-containing protein [Firmicutes bacterium]|nr:DUF1538 domain-containing protein [Bacillota bacterium]
MIKNLRENFINSLKTIGPVVLIVLILTLFMPVKSTFLISFLLSSILLIIGCTLFTFGADLSMVIIGNKIGKDLVKSKKVWLILLVSFIIGTVVTISEPDLLVLAEQITSISNIELILTISIGVGICLLLSSIRSLFGLNLNTMLLIGFILVFILMFFVPVDFIPLAFDSGGVTTGTMSIPFIITLGIGLVSTRVDKKAKEDSFGLVGLASTGPIIMVLLLGLLYNPQEKMVFDNSIYVDFTYSKYLSEFILCFKDVLLAISPILVVFIIYYFITKNVSKVELRKIFSGMFITIIGLTIFLVACNVGFLNMGYYIGEYIAASSYKYWLVPIIMVLSFFISIAEPAVIILIDRVEEFTEGAISRTVLNVALALGVSIASGLSIIRVFTGIPFIYYVIFGYGIALLLMFFIPKTFTAIAFDAGGATGGSLTTAFLLPITIGACYALGGNVFTDAFGLASMVSLVPIITIEIVGLIYQLKTRIIMKIEMLDDSIVDYNWEVSNG